MGMMRNLDQLLQVQRGHLLAWGPVFLGLGIGVYFTVPAEPGTSVYAGAAGLIGVCALVMLRASALGLFARAVAIFVSGFCLAGLRSTSVEAPVLGFRYYGPVEGRIVAIDRSGRDLLRLTLDQVRLMKIPSDRTPERVRISVLLDSGLPEVGARVATTAHLMPPQGPAEPGGFDFRRHAWFLKLGASGYTRVAVLTIANPDQAPSLSRMRSAVAAGLRHRLPGETGAIAAAITTGDRSGVSLETLQDLRASNLAHLLAISGLHMGLVAGFVFAVLRYGLCLVPPLALRISVKKWAAAGALLSGASYLALAGSNVATERAFIMVSVMLGAVLLDRRAISLRAVAVAAILVLLRRPETLLSPGFQMSFAATAALVGVFSVIRDKGVPLGPKWVRPITGLVLSSLVAGLATAPFGAAHFNTVSHYGLLANLLAVPVMGIIVVPAAVAALCLLPFGLEAWALKVMEAGIGWILSVAARIAGFPGTDGPVLQPDPVVLPLIALGGAFVLIWQGRLRFLGVLPVIAAAVIWGKTVRPLALISSDAGLVGVMLSEGRALSRDRGQAFAARSWLENDGDRISQKDAAERGAGTTGQGQSAEALMGAGTRKDSPLWQSQAGPYRLVHVVGQRAADGLTHCGADDILVSTVDLEVIGPCIVLGPTTMRRTGSIRIETDGRLITAADLAGRRHWTNHR